VAEFAIREIISAKSLLSVVARGTSLSCFGLFMHCHGWRRHHAFRRFVTGRAAERIVFSMREVSIDVCRSRCDIVLAVDLMTRKTLS
jgi:hypothetical protein